MALLSIVAPEAKTTEVLYVQNTYSGDTTLIAIPSHEVIGRIEIGKYPDDVIVAPDGMAVYVNRIDGGGLERVPNAGTRTGSCSVRTAGSLMSRTAGRTMSR